MARIVAGGPLDSKSGRIGRASLREHLIQQIAVTLRAHRVDDAAQFQQAGEFEMFIACRSRVVLVAYFNRMA
jgi:hypothetical protein